MNKKDTVHRFFLMVLALLFVSGCGGSEGVGNPQSLTTPDGTTIQIPDSIDLSPPDGVGNTLGTPSIRTLAWPGDFPANIRSGLTDTIMVTGLQTQSAYDFDVTLPPSVDVDETQLFVLNLSEDQQVGGAVCTGDPDCTGTVIHNTVTLQLVSFDSGDATISITPSAEPALINRGSRDNPVPLTLANDQQSFPGTVGAAVQTQQQVSRGQSFYRINGLDQTSRYEIELNI